MRPARLLSVLLPAALALALAACGGASQNAAPLTPDPEPPPTDEQIAALQNAQTDVADNQDAGSSAALATEDPNAVRASDLKASCVRTRRERMDVAKAIAQAWMDLQDRVSVHAAAVRKACVVKDAAGTHLDVLIDATGKPHFKPALKVDDLTCTPSLPPGLTKDEARIALYREDPGFLRQNLLGNTPDWAEDQRCADLDRAAGLETQVTYGDLAGVTTLSKLKTKKP